MPKPSRKERRSGVGKARVRNSRWVHEENDISSIWLPDLRDVSYLNGRSLKEKKLWQLQDDLAHSKDMTYIREKVTEIIVLIYGFQPRPGQLDALMCALQE